MSASVHAEEAVPLAAGSPGTTSGGCPWVCEEPCVAEMFQKSTQYYAKLDLEPVPGATPSAVPMALRARKKGSNGEAKELGERLAGVAEGFAGVRPAGATEAQENALLGDCDALGWDEYSWSDIEAQVQQLAAFLRARGLARGDRLCLFSDAGPEWSLIFIACQYVGVAVCVREPRMKKAEAVQIINTCKPKMVIMNPSELEGVTTWLADPSTSLAEPGTSSTSELERTNSTAQERFPWAAENGKAGDVTCLACDLEALLAEGSAALAGDESLGKCDGKPDDIAVLCTTSGTTGIPKAAMHSQKALCELPPRPASGHSLSTH